MSFQLLLATTNIGKRREVSMILRGCSLVLVFPSDIFDQVPKVCESAQTYQENSLIKAKTYANLAQINTLAEDSGLEIMALGGQPGVKSARYCLGSDHDRCQKVLNNLKNVNDRHARFMTTFCYFDYFKQKSRFFVGTLEGSIAHRKLGNTGFGYDPIFIPDGYTQSISQLGLKIKNKISARSQALAKFVKYINPKLC